jgi:amino acid adenylation domain-containing protein
VTGAAIVPVTVATVERVARDDPARTAATDGHRRISYEELERRSSALARELIAAGIGPETRVAVLADRSLEALVAVLGVVRSGGAYVPIDAEAPPARVQSLIARCGVQHATGLVERGAALPPGVCLHPVPGPETPAGASPHAALDERNAAYVIFTSGSTGEPKGVTVEHRSLEHFVRWSGRAFEVRPGDLFLQFAPLSFDGSIWELFTPLARGAAIRVLAHGEQRDLDALHRVIAEEGVTHIDIVASALWLLRRVDAPTLRWCMTGSEAVRAEVVRRWARPGLTVVNGYGATELTNLSHVARCESVDVDPPLGDPLPGCRSLLLDRFGREVSIGQVGEIHVGGIALARGYERDPVATAQRFVPDPREPGARLYRTGDLAVRRADESLAYVGRVDDQVQIAGHRVEPSEVEVALRHCEGVHEAAVVGVHGPDARTRLVAYVVGDCGDPRHALRALLPRHLIPHTVLRAGELPRVPSGKIDREQLRRAAAEAANGAATAAHASADGQRPSDTPAELLARCVSEVLGCPASPEDRFLDLGGDSLDAMRVVALLQATAGIGLPVSSLLRQQSLGRAAMWRQAATQ